MKKALFSNPALLSGTIEGTVLKNPSFGPEFISLPRIYAAFLPTCQRLPSQATEVKQVKTKKRDPTQHRKKTNLSWKMQMTDIQ